MKNNLARPVAVLLDTRNQDKAMKILNAIHRTKSKVPSGQISVRWVHSRNCYQVYIAGSYIGGCSGETCEDALDELDWFYDTHQGYRETVNFPK